MVCGYPKEHDLEIFDLTAEVYLFIILPGPVGVGWYYYTTLCSQQQQYGNISGVRFRFRQEQVPEINDDDSNRPHNVARAAGA